MPTNANDNRLFLTFHGPNPRDFDRAMEVGAGGYLVLDVDAWWYILRIYQRQPDAKVILRMVGISPTRDKPADVAKRAKSLCDDYRPFALQIGNEWNLGAEHTHGDTAFWSSEIGYLEQLMWWQSFLVAWNNYADVLVGPNLSPDFELERGLRILKPVINQFRYLGIHVYGQLIVPGYAVVNFPGKEIIITEFNVQWAELSSIDKQQVAIAVTDFYEIWYPAFAAVIYYQWDGNKDGAEPGKNFNMVDNYELWTAVKMMNKTPQQPQEVVQPMPMPDYRDSLWIWYQGKIGGANALTKEWMESFLELGWPVLGLQDGWPVELRREDYVFLFCTKGFLYCRDGDWQNVKMGKTKEDLP